MSKRVGRQFKSDVCWGAYERVSHYGANVDVYEVWDKVWGRVGFRIRDRVLEVAGWGGRDMFEVKDDIL